jgi:putative membrane protein
MWLDATLAFLHFTAIFLLFAFLATQYMVLKQPLDERLVRLLGRVDIWYASCAGFALITGFVRAGFGAKGWDFYFGAWPIYAKIALFVVVGLVSIRPTLLFIRWRQALERDRGWTVPAGQQAAARRLVSIEVHLAALIPVFAVMMARGLGS